MAVKLNKGLRSLAGISLAMVALTGCGGMPDLRASLGGISGTYGDPKKGEVAPKQVADPAKTKSLEKIEVYGGKRSQIIEKLIARQSLISDGSSFDQVSRAVLASNARAAESDLHAARLRARAEQFNWLPKIGPNISLTSLGDFVTQLVVEAVVFDNGRLKAERDVAQHDVEAAAVALSQDTNNRVATALTLYVRAERARNEKRVAATAQKRMGEFVSIIRQRVEGGVSNMADQRVAESKLQELDAEYARAEEAELTAMAELNAMAQAQLSSVSGLGQLTPTAMGGLTPLNVLLARAEGNRKVAEARVRRAAMLPGITAGGTVGEGSQVGVKVSGESLVGVGTGAALEAVKASQDAALRGVRQAEEDTRRVVERLSQKRASLKRQQIESKRLVADANRTYELFLDQFRNSGRPIMEVVSIYENAMRLERDSVRLQYELTEIEVEISSMYGNLVDGGNV